MNTVIPGDFLDDDRLHEECGVVGVFGSDDAAALAALSLYSLQHRGQEGCGIATWDGKLFHTERHLGLVGDNLTGAEVIARLPGSVAIGHTRYATQGGTLLRNIQPLFADLSTGGFAIGHNGNLTNSRALREELVRDGAIFQSTSDTEVILQLIARSRRVGVIDRFIDALRQVEGAYALVCVTNNMLIAARDPFGIRPLVLGDLNGVPIVASETCALDIVGARYVRMVENGEVIVITRDSNGKPKLECLRPFGTLPKRPCVFEFVYFSRPDSVLEGRSVYEVRRRMGERLAAEQPASADIVVPVPDSSVPAAIGFAHASGLPYELGIIRNHYVGRTFIQPKQEIRELGVKMKHSANRQVLRGKRVVLLEDSIVRGTTSKRIVQIVREAGAKEVHFRVACPPIMYPDFYGIDMPRREELIAANMSVPEITKALGVNSLGFLSVDGLYKAMGETARDDANPQFTDHCFTGEYPTVLTDHKADRASKDLQLSFLVEA